MEYAGVPQSLSGAQLDTNLPIRLAHMEDLPHVSTNTRILVRINQYYEAISDTPTVLDRDMSALHVYSPTEASIISKYTSEGPPATLALSYMNYNINRYAVKY
jgi:hypothetical protein